MAQEICRVNLDTFGQIMDKYFEALEQSATATTEAEKARAESVVQVCRQMIAEWNG